MDGIGNHGGTLTDCRFQARRGNPAARQGIESLTLCHWGGVFRVNTFPMQLQGILPASDRMSAGAISRSDLSPDFLAVPESAEAKAIEEAKKGSAEAFETLYHAHKRRIYSLCLRMTGNTADAEDLTQEAFLQVFRKLGTFRGEAAFSTWMHRLAVNLVLMRLRKKGILASSLEEPGESDSEDSRQRDFGTPDVSLTGLVDRVGLERAMQALPTGYRTVFYLHDVEGFEHKEIAAMIGCSVGNSKSQLHKARMKLRELLRGKPSPPGENELPEVSNSLEAPESAGTTGSEIP